ncbi:hypothetical protein [Streptomyces sp. NPDC058240]|uniref:hypothetical protein n=1 Tax=Streptomyces sp. NPDC058240 TaxID=3346396 RepID=UPI0036EA9116
MISILPTGEEETEGAGETDDGGVALGDGELPPPLFEHPLAAAANSPATITAAAVLARFPIKSSSGRAAGPTAL